MLYLLLAIFCSTIIVLLFKSYPHYQVNTFQAIVVNYFVCVAIGLALSETSPFKMKLWQEAWFPISLVLGVSFIGCFQLMGITAQKVGITVTSVANKLSMVMTVIAAFILYQDEVNLFKILGILLAIVAVILSSIQNKSTNQPIPRIYLFFPLFIFLWSGLIEVLMNYAQVYYLPDENANNNFLVFLFGLAGTLGIIFLLYQIIFQKVKLNWQSLVGGFLLGIPNYGSAYFLLKALDTSGLESSVVFPLVNLSVVGISALSAYLIFKEHLSKINLAGIGFAFLSIILIAMA